MTAHASAALEYLRSRRAAAVIADLDVEDSFAVCKAARVQDDRPAIPVTAADAEKVPEALLAGCDSVLVKPFAPNLLIARISRLLRGRSDELRMRSAHQRLKVNHLLQRSAELIGGTNHIWPDQSCPYCAHTGVTSFDHASHRKAWYACLACRKVWMAKMVG
jgi:DNA-binding response OmpR family regulator